MDIRNYRALRVAVPLRGRSGPILFVADAPKLWRRSAAYRKWEVESCQNALEQQFLKLLEGMLPEKTEAVVIADRGFGRFGAAARHLAEACFDVLTKEQPDRGCRALIRGRAGEASARLSHGPRGPGDEWHTFPPHIHAP